MGEGKYLDERRFKEEFDPSTRTNIPVEHVNQTKKKPKRFWKEECPELDVDDQRHFLNLIPEWMQELIALLPLDNFNYSEEKLIEYVFGEPHDNVEDDEQVTRAGFVIKKEAPKGKRKPGKKVRKKFKIIVPEPTPTAQRLRNSIWAEYDRVQAAHARILVISNVVRGICTMSYFVHKFCTDEKLLTWILYPPAAYKEAMGDILDVGLRQMRQIMAHPVTDRYGVVNTKLCDIKFRILQHVDMRQKGAIIQRIDQRNLNMNWEMAKGEVPLGDGGEQSLEDIERKIKKLEGESKRLSSPKSQVIDVEAIESNDKLALSEAEGVMTEAKAEALKERTLQALHDEVNTKSTK